MSFHHMQRGDAGNNGTAGARLEYGVVNGAVQRRTEEFSRRTRQHTVVENVNGTPADNGIDGNAVASVNRSPMNTPAPQL